MSINISKLLSSNWVITLTATLIGVFLALYLNEWIASKNLSSQKSIATQNILAEISVNQKNIEKSVISHNKLMDVLKFLSAYVNEENDLIAPSDSMNNFKNKYPEIVTLTDSFLLSEAVYRYKGEFNLDLVAPSHIHLTTIAWKTLKNSGFSTTYGFECLMYLESIDMVAKEVLEHDKELFEYLNGLVLTETDNGKLLECLNLLISYETTLLSIYKKSEEELENCG